MDYNIIKILFAGDFYSTSPNSINFSDKLSELFNSCDIKVVNFEGALPNGDLTIPNKTVLRQSIDSPGWCEQNGFNVITLANNHAYDYGEEGIRSTIDSFKNACVLGAGEWEEAYKIKYITVNEITIGFLSASTADLSSLKDKWTDYEKIGVAWINSPEINKLIIDAKKECDFLFVLPHAGLEYMNVPLPEWRDRYRELMDLGADGIIASHPHVPQGIEEYKGKPIYYSLGNFFFDLEGKQTNKEYWNNGLIAIIEIKNNELFFNHISIQSKEKLIDIDESEKIKEHIINISNILKDNNRYIEQVNKDVLYHYNTYINWLLSGLNSKEISFNLRNILGVIKSLFISKPNYKSALHQIREESTRWTIIRALKLISKTEL